MAIQNDMRSKSHLPIELYNLDNDFNEPKNVASEHPNTIKNTELFFAIASDQLL